MNKITINNFAAMNMIYSRYSFEYFLESLKRLDIQNFELWTGAPHLNNFVPSLSDVGKIKKQVKDHKLNIVCVTPEQVMYPHNIAATDKGLREFSLNYFLKYIEMTAELETDKMLCCAGWGNYDDKLEDSWERSIEGLSILLERARKVGIKLAFEILCPNESNLVYNFETTKKMMDTFSNPNFTLCLDTVPIKLSNSNLPEFFNEFKQRISHVHMTDGNPTGHIPVGLGEHPIGQYIDELGEYDYNGYITLEIGNSAWQKKPEEATKIAFDTVKSFL